MAKQLSALAAAFMASGGSVDVGRGRTITAAGEARKAIAKKVAPSGRFVDPKVTKAWHADRDAKLAEVKAMREMLRNTPCPGHSGSGCLALVDGKRCDGKHRAHDDRNKNIHVRNGQCSWCGGYVI